MSFLNKLLFLLDKNSKKKFFFVFILILIASFLEMIGIGFIIPIANLISNNQTSINSYTTILGKNFLTIINIEKNQLIFILMIIFLIFYVIKAFYLTLTTWLQSKFIYNLNFDISRKLFKNYLHKNYLYWSKQNTSDKIKNITQEVNLITIYIVDPCLVILTELFILISIISLLLYYNFFGTLYCIFFILVAFIVWQKFISNKLKNISVLRSEYDTLLFKQIQESFLGIKDIKMYGREVNCLKNFENNLLDLKSIKTKFTLIINLPKIYLELVAIICFVVLVLFSIYFLKSLDNLLPNLALFAAAAFKLIPSLNRLIIASQNIKYGQTALNNIVNDIETDNFLDQKFNDQLEKIKFVEKINIRNISYSYDVKKIILNNINFEIKKGEIIGIIGQSGSGKTTFVDILSGLILPTSGRITSDNIDIQKNIRSWQDQIGYIQQNTYLMDDSIKNNIAFGLNSSEIDYLHLKNAINISQLNDLVNELPLGIEATIGERGIKLSGGQRQRIGIARAFYKNPEILIFDESTNSLDSETEEKILNNFKKFRENKTIIIISHNRESLKKCNKIIKIEKGTLKEVMLKNK
jgi:ABC-type bacteriocin/lantibiotic exporter with double-glycine peptidase domain